MTEVTERYHRNALLFGAKGQARLRETTVVIVGAGGLGSPLAQHLALLGVGKISVADFDELDESNRNRFVGARPDDPVPGSKKVDLVCRNIREINPDVEAEPIPFGLVSERTFEAVRAGDWVFGCFDRDGPRAILNELTAAYDKPYIDLASDVAEDGCYGGHVCVSIGGQGCLSCLGLLDHRAVRRYLESPDALEAENRIYGVHTDALEKKGPSVSPLNGVIASLAAMEFMVAVTGIREPTRLQRYRGWESKVVVTRDDPVSGCPICAGVHKLGQEADAERYLRIPHLRTK